MFELKKSLTGILLFTSICCGVVQAQGVKMYTDRAPTAVEMANILFSSQSDQALLAKPSKMKMRSISFGKPKKQEPTISYAQSGSQSQNSIGLPIKFGYNSTAILPESLPFLEEVGKMLEMPAYAQKKLVVEGHTDASGSRGYNQYLSEKRAEAVKVYLMDRFSITKDRLVVNGMGENQPLAGLSPYAATNRRVQFYSAP